MLEPCLDSPESPPGPLGPEPGWPPDGPNLSPRSQFFLGTSAPVVPAKFDWMLYRGERFTVDVEGHKLGITCELVPRRRLKVFLDGTLLRETGAIARGLSLRLFGRIEVECQWYQFTLGDGLGIRVNGVPVEGSFLDPTVRMHKGLIPATAYAIIGRHHNLFLLGR